MSKETALATITETVNSEPAQTPGLQAAPSLVTEAAPSAEPKKLDSDRFAALAKKEAEFVKRQQEAKRLKEEADSVLSKAKQFEEMKKTDPVAALKMIGFSETDIFNFMAAQEKPELTPEEKAAKAASEAAAAKIKEFEDLHAQKAKEDQEKRDAKVLTEFKSGISQAIASNKEKFEYCAHYGSAAESLVYETVLKIVAESEGKDIPTIEEALELVESYYEEEDKSLMSLKKRQPKVEETVATEKKPLERSRTVTTPAGSTPIAPTITKTRTLHNGAAATVASAAAPRGKETPQQKKERLVREFKEKYGH